MMKRFYALLLAIVAVIGVHGKVFSVDGIRYGTDGWMDVKGHLLEVEDGSGFAIVLGLEDNSNISELTIPETVYYEGKPLIVKYIDGNAFANCEDLTSVTIGSQIEHIGYRAFYGCSNLSKFNIPSSVIDIESQVFEGTAWYNNQPDELVYKDNVLLGRKTLFIEGHVDIADGTRVIAGRVFMYCKNMTSVNIPNTVVSIGESAFYQAGIAELTIPNSVTNIFSNAFNYCENLNKIISLIETPFDLGDTVFKGTKFFATLFVPAGTKSLYEAADGWNVFTNIVEMEPENKELKVGDTFVADGILYQVSNKNPKEVSVGVNWWFDGTYHEELVDLPAVNKDTIGAIIIPSIVTGTDENTYSVTSIRYQTFLDCVNITSVIIGKNVKTIGNEAFARCGKLVDVTIPNSVTSIGKQAFVFCNLTSVTIPNSLTSIEAGVFAWNANLTSVNIPTSITKIGDRAFYNCGSLSTITIPNSVTSIGARAFEVNSLAEVKSYIEEPFSAIPVSESMGFAMPVFGVKDFENATLYVPFGTKALYEVTDGWKEFKNIVEMTSYDVLDDNTAAAHFLQPDEEGKVEIPETVEIDGKTYTVTEIAANAFKDNKDLTEVTIPGTVTKIGEGAFAGCENLRAVYVFALDPISLTAAEARSMATRAAENVPSQFDGVDFDACTLYVPIGSEQKYREAEGWKLFAHIVGVEDPSGIATVGAEQNGGKAAYDLRGQRVVSPSKGIYIIDGKKVVVK